LKIQGYFGQLMGFQRYILARERSCYLCNNHPAKIRANLARAILKIYGEPPVLEETMRYVEKNIGMLSS